MLWKLNLCWQMPAAAELHHGTEHTHYREEANWIHKSADSSRFIVALGFMGNISGTVVQFVRGSL